jgi:hypothetical protein
MGRSTPAPTNKVVPTDNFIDGNVFDPIKKPEEIKKPDVKPEKKVVKKQSGYKKQSSGLNLV